MEPQLGMTSTPYCYGESEPGYKEDDHHIDRVEVEEKDIWLLLLSMLS
jgi:hypothetical protein